MTAPIVQSSVDEGGPDEEQKAMMAEMGFATFGSKGKGPKAKRVKVRPDGEVNVGTGGNVIPLGQGRRRGGRGGGGAGGGAGGDGGVGSAGDGDGLGSERVEDADDDGAGEGVGGVRLPHEDVGSKDEERYEDPRYDEDGDEDTPVRSESSLPPRPATNTLPLKPPSASYPVMGMGAPGTGSGGGWGQSQRRRDGKKEDGSWDWQALRKGVRDERGDMAFYDGSFVEDPWRALRGETR